MIDYKALVENLQTDRIIEMMCALGATDYQEDDKAVIFPTICHHDNENDASMKLYYYKDTHLFMCYSHCGGQSIFKFLEHYFTERAIPYDWNKILEIVKKCSTYGETFDSFESIPYERIAEKYRIEEKSKILAEYNPKVLDTFIKYYPPEWLKDGITKAAMDKYNIRYSISQHKIIIPHYDVWGRLVGIRGRALDAWEIENIGKYMPVEIEGKWYAHQLSLNLYGLNFNKEAIRKNGVVYVFEAEKSVLQIERFSMDNCAVAVCGSNFHKYHLHLLLKQCHPKEIIICFDNEELKGSDEYFNKLYKICKKYSNYCNMSFIYDRNKLTKPKDSPTDEGEEIFRKLLKERVKTY